MAATVLEEAGLNGTETDKESALKWNANYIDETTSYGIVDKEVDFLINNC